MTQYAIVFISSSLGVAAAHLADYKMYGAPAPQSKNAMDYSRFRYLDHLITEWSGKKTNTINFSNSAALVSEDLLIAKEAVRLQGKPSLIILALAPRDFLDHYTSAYHRSRLAQILLNRQASALWENRKTPQENLDKWMCKLWPYYSQRVEYRDLVIKATCEKLNRSVDLFSASKLSNSIHKANVLPKTSDEKITEGQQKKQSDQAALTPLILIDEILPESTLLKYDSDYRGRYLPLDIERWNQEMDSLESFIKFCTAENIPLLLVSMPISERNRCLLPQEFLAKHMRAIKEKVKTSSVRFLDLMADQRFTAADFSDTVHLRSDGSVKLAKIISDEVKQQNLLPFSDHHD